METISRFTALMECRTERKLVKALVQLGYSYGFEQTMIAVAPGIPSSLDDFYLKGNVSAEWLALYNRKHFINIDPTISHCASRLTPLLWGPKIFTGNKQKAMYEEAANFGLRSGISLPFHGIKGEKGILHLAKNETPNEQLNRKIMRITPELSMMRDYAFQAAMRRFKKQTPRPFEQTLSNRELECLTWCSTGKSSWEIAQILNCAESTVNFHILNLRRKLNVSSRRQAVVKAMHLGLLHYQPPQITMTNKIPKTIET